MSSRTSCGTRAGSVGLHQLALAGRAAVCWGQRGASAPGSRSEPLCREVGAVAPGGRRHCCGWQGRCARRVVGAAALDGRQGLLHRAARATAQERQEPPPCQAEGAGRRRRALGAPGGRSSRMIGLQDPPTSGITSGPCCAMAMATDVNDWQRCSWARRRESRATAQSGRQELFCRVAGAVAPGGRSWCAW